MENGKLYVSVDSLNSSDDLKTEIEEMRAGHENHVHRENRQNAADTLCLSLSQHEQTTDPYASYSFEITYSYAMHRYVVTTKRSPQEFGSETTSENDFEDPRGVAGYIASFNIRKWFLGGLTPGQQSLLDAIDNDDLQGVKESLKERADINQRGIHGDPCLVRAVKFCGTELVKTLLESGPDLEMTDQAQNTALHWSIIKNRNDVFNLLLRSGANINALNDEGENGLMIAAGFNNLDALNFFLRKGFNPALRNKSGKDALEMAISLGQEKTARLLMENGAVLKPDEALGRFLKACELGYLEMVVLLADTGVPLDQAGCIIPEHRDSDATGLMTAASLGHNTVVEFLIGKGVTVDKKKSCGKTALMFAAQGNHIKTVKLLLDAGAAIEATDNQGRTPLHQALECCSLNAAGYLMLRGADPSKIKNRTAIMDEGIEQIQEYRERLEDNIRIALESSS